MRLFPLALIATSLFAQPRIDNVLLRMVPPGATSLVGARVSEIRDTAFYRDIVQQQKIPQLDLFARDTGFDPRRDVRELLYATTKSGGVLLARGTFKVNPQALSDGKLIRHGVYNIETLGDNGFCILDATLAAAGDVVSVKAALDEWTAGQHIAAQSLLAHAKAIDANQPFWGISTGFAGFLADNLPHAASGIDFSKIFRGLEDTWFEATFTNGFKGLVHGATATDQDAANLRDTAKGLIGFGRLNVPENQPEMLKLWDGFEVEQQGRIVEIKIDVAQNLVDRLVQLLTAPQAGRGRGRGRGLPAPPR
jgi:hypothetical protein